MTKKTLIFLILLTIFSFGLRASALRINHPFWVDEFSSGRQALLLKEIVLEGQSNLLPFIEANNSLTHLLIAVSFAIAGVSETAARFPSVIFGAFLPAALFLLGKKLFSTRVAVVAAVLCACSYLEITWSTQARGYVLQQFLGVLALLSYYQWKEKFQTKWLLSLSILTLLGFFTHVLFAFVVIAIAIDFVITKPRELRRLLSRRSTHILGLVFVVVGAVLAYRLGIIQLLTNGVTFGFFALHNNLWYYHALLWREQTLLTLLLFVGVLWQLRHFRSTPWAILILLALQVVFVTFFFGHYMTKYLVPVIQYFFLFAAVGASAIADGVTGNSSQAPRKTITLGVLCILVLFILVNGDNFVLKPKPYYSVNKDMRDIALVDYHQAYNIIQQKGQLAQGQTAVIETWPDRPRWYLGEDNSYFIFRWEDEGFHKQTAFSFNELNEKVVADQHNIRLISTVADLQNVMATYPRGFLWIDDSSLPADVIAYAQEHLHTELKTDHYMYDENPYSLWPATLYSWGVE